MESGPHTFKILSIDGGGIKGLHSAMVLAEIERAFGVKMCDYFDMICGTSTGGLIALGLSLGKPAQELVKLYAEDGPNIFGAVGLVSIFKSIFGGVQQMIAWGKYRNVKLKRAVERILETSKMSNAQTLLCIPTFNLTAGKPRVFKFPHKEGKYAVNKYGSMLDVALATTAAPTYFPIAEIEDEYYVDGGVWANNPTLCGLQDALEYFVGADKQLQGVNQGKVFDKYAILSIGSVHEDAAWNMKGHFGLKKRKTRSFFGWREKLLQTALDGQSYSVHRLLKVLIKNTKVPGDYVRIESYPLSAQHREVVGLDKAASASISLLRSQGRKVGQDYTSTGEKRESLELFFKNKKQYKTK